MGYTWKISRYTNTDKEGIFKLKSLVYPDADKEEWTREWNWRYRDRPGLEDNPYIFVAKDAGEVVGHHAASMFLLKFGDRILKSLLGISAMTHDGYRGQKIYQNIIKTYQETARNEIGYFLSLGFPNNISFDITIRKMGRYPVSRIRGLQKPIDWKRFIHEKMPFKNRILKNLAGSAGSIVGPVYYRSKRIKKDPNVAVKQVTMLDDRVNALWDNVSNQALIMPVKKMDYLNWRYIGHPKYEYFIYVAENKEKISGYLILNTNKRTDEYIIVDLLAENDFIAGQLIESAENQAKKDKKNILSYFVAGKNIYENAFKDSGFIFLPKNRGNHIVTFNSPEFTEEEVTSLRNKENWYVQLGDSDVY